MYAYVYTEDPHPGRCGCRSFNPNTGQYERCLGEADKLHICAWENAPMPEPASSGVRRKIERPPWKSQLPEDVEKQDPDV